MDFTPAQILIVDDDPLNRMMLKMALQREGHTVLESANGSEALDLLASDRPELVITDIEMPVMDGYTLLERRHEDPRLRELPFIVISGVDEMASIVRCIGLGAEDYLPKPFDPVLLRARISASLEKKRLRDKEQELLATVTRQADELTAWNRELSTRVDEKVREVDRLSRMGRFLAPQVAQAIAGGSEDVLRSHRREITVLFCDLRGFTPFAETAEPEDVMAVLSELHEALGPLIFSHQGTLAQFTGDGMMVFFNDPIPCIDPAFRAARLAIDMRDCAMELAVGWRKRGYQLELGVGLAIGFATCGQVGFEGRSEYTAIGSVTNLASRLCGEAKGGQILVSQRVMALVQTEFLADSVGELALKGFARPVPSFSLMGRR